MPTAFTENEKKQIRKKLMESAEVCLGTFGVKKTTVDQLVQMAGISKGAFYQFFPSKEILFFRVLEEFQSTSINIEVASQDKVHNHQTEVFTETLYKIYQQVKDSFLMNIIRSGELELLMRKIPIEELARHHSFDELLTKNLFREFDMKDNVDSRIAAASLRAIFLSMIHVNEIGEKEFDQVLKTLLRGVALQLIEEDE